jgi:hypothetical protein
VEVAGVVQPDIGLDHVFQRAAGLGQDGDQVLDDLVGLGHDAAVDDLAILIHRHLAGHEDEAVGDGGLAEGQGLAAGARGGGRADALDGQEGLLTQGRFSLQEPRRM